MIPIDYKETIPDRRRKVLVFQSQSMAWTDSGRSGYALVYVYDGSQFYIFD